jgi:hypothetical protein
MKHIRNWSYAIVEREVRANLVYRDFGGPFLFMPQQPKCGPY